jgi:hypothetical protein
VFAICFVVGRPVSVVNRNDSEGREESAPSGKIGPPRTRFPSYIDSCLFANCSGSHFGVTSIYHGGRRNPIFYYHIFYFIFYFVYQVHFFFLEYMAQNQGPFQA